MTDNDSSALKLILLVIGVIVVGFGAASMVGAFSVTGDIENSQEQNIEKTTTTLQNSETGEVKEFFIEAFQFGYEPSTITVNKGDTVRIKATSTDVPHGLAISEFGVNMYLQPGKTETTEFVADKAGTFAFYCSVVCGRGHSSMRGQLIVKG